jgi:hypothetical protein
MTAKRVASWVGGVLVALVVLGGTAHAAAGSGHSTADCITCAICSCLEAFFS